MAEKQIVKINNQDLRVKQFKDQRVVTFKDIDMVHGRPEGTAGRNFRENKNRFIESEDYFSIKLTNDEIRRQFGAGKNASEITLITESGYLMLVKSFTDDLAWEVQRQLVNSYFRAKSAKTSPVDKQKEIEARYNNSLARRARELMRIAEKPEINPRYKQVLYSYASTIVAGKELLPLPEAGERTYTAKEIGKMLNPPISANMVGRLAKLHNLKTEQYGKWFHDKSRHSCKEVETFRYYENIVPVLQGVLSGMEQ
jgi:hypothetical protein